MSASRVEQLAAAVADGDSIDWKSAQAVLRTDADRCVASQLHDLSSISVPPESLAPVAVERLPVALRFAGSLSRGMTLLGVIGFVVAWFLEGAGRRSVFLLGLALFGGTALWLDITGRDDRRALALAGVYWTSAASFSHDLILAVFRLLPVHLDLLKGVRPEAFFPAFLWQFARDFPRVTRFGSIDRLSRLGTTLATAAGLVLFGVNVAGQLPVGQWLVLLSFLDRTYQQGRWFWLIVFAAALAALTCVVVRGELADRKERGRVRAFLWSIAAALVPVSVVVFLESAWPTFAAFTRTGIGRVLADLIVYPPMLACPVLTAYIVLAHDLLDIKAAAQRAVRYLLTRWLIAWGTSIPAAILVVVVYLHRTQPLAAVLSTPNAQFLVWVAGLGALLLVFRDQLLGALDRWMLDDLSDPAGTLAELSDQLRTVRTLMELSTLVARAIERTLQSAADVYMIDSNETLVCASRTRSPSWARSLVPVLLQGAGGPCVVEPRGRGSYFALLSTDDRLVIQREGIMAMCPIMPPGGGRIRSVVTLKTRRNALSLSRRDVQFLTAVCAAAALAHAGLEQAGGPEPVQDELALQCPVCFRIDTWRPDAGICVCGGAWERAALPHVIAGRFRLELFIGAGGMGVVYKALDLLLRRSVAVKTLPRLSVEASTRLLEEARAMASLQHPHMAILYGAELWRGTPVLLVEYFEGKTLSDRLHDGPLPIETAFQIGTTLADALDYLHKTGRSHGDIKPSNIAFTNGGVVKLLDFGLSRSLRDHAAFEPLGGTLAYLSPDVLDGHAPGPAADVWALSVVIFQTFVGFHPFLIDRDIAGRIRAGFHDRAMLQPVVAPTISECLCELLSVAPGVRPLSARALRERLEHVRISSGVRSHMMH